MPIAFLLEEQFESVEAIRQSRDRRPFSSLVALRWFFLDAGPRASVSDYPHPIASAATYVGIEEDY
jgi:hypothetical protein